MTEAPPAESVVLPDFYADPNAVLKDEGTQWRFGRRPDYSKTRQFFAETKKMSHEAGSLPQLVENLVKNWEVEASYKTRLSDWRTINHDKYTFAMNGGPSLPVEHMLGNGTYNAILTSSDYYCPAHNDFTRSHKVFKRMMPIFAWEVLEVYSGLPKVAFRWRHWGYMKNDYVALNNKGEKVCAKAHGGIIDIEGVTVADLDENMKVTRLETWFDPMSIFTQAAPNGVTKVTASSPSTSLAPSNVDLNAEHGLQQPATRLTDANVASGGHEAAQTTPCPTLEQDASVSGNLTAQEAEDTGAGDESAQVAPEAAQGRGIAQTEGSESVEAVMPVPERSEGKESGLIDIQEDVLKTVPEVPPEVSKPSSTAGSESDRQSLDSEPGFRAYTLHASHDQTEDQIAGIHPMPNAVQALDPETKQDAEMFGCPFLRSS